MLGVSLPGDVLLGGAGGHGDVARGGGEPVQVTPGGGRHPGEDAGLPDKTSGNIIKITPDKSLKGVTIIIHQPCINQSLSEAWQKLEAFLRDSSSQEKVNIKSDLTQVTD